MFPKNMYLENLIDVYDSEGRKFDMDAMGLLGLKLQIPSPSYKNISHEVDGRGGETVTDRLLQSRNLSATFVTMADDYKGSLKLRDTLYRLLGNGGFFFVSETKIPNRRWRVYADEWTPERVNVKVHMLELPLICTDGFSESINTITRRYSSSSFRFNNEGDLDIDPLIHSDLQIEFYGASSNLKIRNITTGQEWSWTGTTISSDAIRLQSVRSLKNGVSIFGQTNKKLLKMVPGWNDFEIVGATGSFETVIKTRFYFL